MIICLGPVCVPLWPILILALMPLWNRLTPERQEKLQAWWDSTGYPTFVHPWFSKLPARVQKLLLIGLPKRKNGKADATSCSTEEQKKPLIEPPTFTPGEVSTPSDYEEWKALLNKATPAQKLFVKFTADWCGPCKKIAPQFADLAKQFPKHRFIEVDIDELDQVAADWDVNAIPHFKVFQKTSEALEALKGPTPAKLEALVQKHAT